MSHLVSIQTTLHDPIAIAAACQRLGLAAPVHGTVDLFSAQATGLQVKLPDWQYPVVIDTLTGQIQLDDYNGHWGDRRHLDEFVQMYSVEKCKLEARRKGLQVTEQMLGDGSVRLHIVEAN